MAKAHYERDDEGGHGAREFPSPTARDGRIRPNSARSGRGQGVGSSKEMIRCLQCGYVYDKKRTDTSGGKMIGDTTEGLGGLEDVVLQSASYTIGGQTYTDSYADVRTVSEGAGCPDCGTKNGAR